MEGLRSLLPLPPPFRAKERLDFSVLTVLDYCSVGLQEGVTFKSEKTSQPHDYPELT